MNDQARRPYNVLFVCTGNSCRSIMAEAILNRTGAGKFQAYSAGTNPIGSLNPRAVALLQRMHHPVEGLSSKSWDLFTRDKNPDAPEFDFVFTVCDDAAGVACPTWPGEPMVAHWGLPDPVKFEGNDAETAVVFADTYRMLSNRIDLFVNLPISGLDRLSLQKRLDRIGASTAEPATSQ